MFSIKSRIGIVSALLCVGPLVGQPGSGEKPKPLAPEVRKALKDAGADLGWWGYTDRWSPDYHDGEQGKAGSVLSLRFGENPKPGALAKLPVPDQEFGVTLFGADDGQVKELAGYKKLHHLSLAQASVTDDGLKTVGGMSELRYLDLDSPKITDAGIKHLTKLSKLQALQFGGDGLTNAGFKDLLTLKTLRRLDIGGAKVTDLTGISRLEGLEFVNLYRIQFAPGNLKELGKCKKIVALHLAFTKIDGAGLKDLAGLENLQWLTLERTNISDADLKELTRFKELNELNLVFTPVTDEGLQQLAALKKLRFLRLGGDATEKGAERLKKSIPELRVIWG